MRATRLAAESIRASPVWKVASHGSVFWAEALSAGMSRLMAAIGSRCSSRGSRLDGATNDAVACEIVE
jgi:hypothetical protein